MNIRKGIYETLMMSIYVAVIAWLFVFALTLGGAIPLIIAMFDTGFNLFAIVFYSVSWVLVLIYNSLDDAEGTIESACYFIARLMNVKY